MKASQVVVCVIVGFLGLLAFILSIAAQSNRVKAEEVRFSGDGTCSYPSSPACALGVIAALSLLVAQIVGNSCGGCICCCAKRALSNSTTKGIAIACLLISWISTILCFIIVLIAAVVNSSISFSTSDEGLCPYPRSWLFPVGAFFALVSTLTLLAFYMLVVANHNVQQHTPPSNSTTVEMPHYTPSYK